ncbi:MAG: porin family protein [Pararhodobacter sp.]|nr:porin family protein [Pararhodobacter sp.]
MKKLATASAALLFSATTALGGTLTYVDPEPQVYTPAPAPAFSWAGGYVGLFAGRAHGTYTLGVSELDELGPDVDVRSTVGGAFVGYNWQHGNTVFGLELDASTGPSGVTEQGTLGDDWSCISGDCYVDIRSVITLRGRLGIAADRMHFYGTAGLAHARVSGGIEDSAQEGSGSATGWVAGVGAEWAASENFLLRAEYLHHDLGALPFGTGSGETFDGVGSFGVVRLGGAFRF